MTAENNGSILLIDDDPALGVTLTALLTQAGFEPTHALSGPAGLEILARQMVDVVICDVRMEEMDGMEVLARIREGWPDTPVVMLTAHGTIPLAVDAMKRGAYDFMTKPFDREELIYTLTKAVTAARHHDGLPPRAALPASGFVGRSKATEDVEALIAKVARGKSTVLITGESGTGKDVAARAIHAQSARCDGPFMKIHCAALPDTLLEGELFGFEKGAFTGAVKSKAGRIELAEGGTVFLDEIGDVTPAFQVKLLRLLQDREYERLGSESTLKADVRFIAATHRDLPVMVKEGKFREDLYYRLSVVPIHMPPLGTRREEIPDLARHFFKELAAANERTDISIDEDAISALAAIEWPGNIRQLQNFVERLVVLADGPIVTREDVVRQAGDDPAQQTTAASSAVTLPELRREAEADALREALRRTKNNRTDAARLLGVSRRTLYNKLRELGLNG